MKKITVDYCSSVLDAVNVLLKYKEKGESVYCEFNGYKLYSDNVTVDSAYLEIVGCTYEELKKVQAEYSEKFKKNELDVTKDAFDKIPEKIEKGEKFIYKFRMKEWMRFLSEDASSIFHGDVSDFVLIIMDEMEKGTSVDDIINMIKNQNFLGLSCNCVLNAILKYSKNGYPIVNGYRDLTENERTYIEEILKENAKFSEDVNNAFEVNKNRIDNLNSLVELLRINDKTKEL